MAENFTGPPGSTPTKQFAITPSDATILDPKPRYIVCLTAGTCVIEDWFGTSISYPMTAGQERAIVAKKVKAASTGTWAYTV